MTGGPLISEEGEGALYSESFGISALLPIPVWPRASVLASLSTHSLLCEMKEYGLGLVHPSLSLSELCGNDRCAHFTDEKTEAQRG